MAGIFKNNDIRGKVGEDLNQVFCEKLGFLFADHIGPGKSVAIAGDTRTSTPILKKSLSDGLLKGGVNVYDLGIGPTPMTYFVAAHHEKIDEAIMITGSHNPPDQNGIKISDSTGQSYHYENLFSILEQKLSDFSLVLSQIPLKGKIYDAADLRNSYYDFLVKEVTLTNKFSIIVDCGRGATFDFTKVLDSIGVQFSAIGTNPDEPSDDPPPDPAKPQTFEKLKSKINDHEIAIAFDTDGDRVGFMTNSKNIISPDLVTMLLAENVKLRNPTPRVIIDVKVSKSTKEYIESIGGVVSLSQVGHSYIHENLITEDAHLAAELSGHYYFHDRYYGFDDGLYTALRFLEVVDNLIGEGIKLDDKLDQLPRYSSTPEFRDHIAYETIDVILSELDQYVLEKGGIRIRIDGIRGEFEDGWFLARKSGTEEILSYRVEGSTPEAKSRLLSDIKEIIDRYR